MLIEAEAEAEEFWQKNCLEKGHYKISHILINHKFNVCNVYRIDGRLFLEVAASESKHSAVLQ